jgi:hypothetical protein
VLFWLRVRASLLAIRCEHFRALAAYRRAFVHHWNLKFAREPMNPAANILCQPYRESLTVTFRGEAKRVSEHPAQSLRLKLFA